MKFHLICTLSLILVASVLVRGEPMYEAVRILESLSYKGVNVKEQIWELNYALELNRENKTAEAESTASRVLMELKELEAQLPSFLAWQTLRTGTTLFGLMSIPPVFYYFFPRLYSLAWAYARRNWIVRRMENHASRR